ncbi:hypothetical protein BKA93DRAFT_728758 [Sparassis latifolia]
MRLGTTDEDLALYRTLDKKDLHVKTAVIKASTFGLRNVNLAWFWTHNLLSPITDITGSSLSDRSLGLLLIYPPVYRVNWLRARAQYERWREIATFKGNTEQWAHWLEMTDPSWRGHVCYAARQVSMWRTFASHATDAFSHILALDIEDERAGHENVL